LESDLVFCDEQSASLAYEAGRDPLRRACRPLFDGGKHQAQLEDRRALYDGYVASYRSTVLTAFKEVEDELATLRILSQERQQQDDAVRSAQTALTRA
jgi:outer membrane protein TolC